MNPESNRETRILYQLGTALVGAVAVFVVLVLFAADPAHGLNQTRFLGSAIVWSLAFLAIALLRDRRIGNLLMAIAAGFVPASVMHILIPNWGLLPTSAVVAALAVTIGAIIHWRGRANLRSE